VVLSEAEHPLFEPIFATEARDLGTRLRLAMARAIVARHAREIRVCTTPGVGTAVRVTFR
jgi:hypothetical protein